MTYWYRTPDDVHPSEGAWSNRIKWCEENCHGTWRYKLQGVFHFQSEADYLLFLLAWS